MPRRPANADNPTDPHKLTVASVALLPTTGAQYRVRDAGRDALPGFAVQVSRDGSKAFTLDYRIRGDRTSYRMTFGRFPGQSPETARMLARTAKELAKSGGDPRAEERTAAVARREAREAAKAARAAAAAEALELSRHTVHQLALDYIHDHRTELKDSTESLYRTTVARCLAGSFGARPIASITQSDVRELIRTVQEGELPDGIPKRKGKNAKTGGEGAARTLRRFLKSLWNYAEEERNLVSGKCPVPRAKHLGFEELKTERFLTPAECADLLRALDTAATVGLPAAPHRARKPATGPSVKHRSAEATAPRPANPVAVAAIRLALLTGWRRGEILTLRWDMLRQDLGRVILRDTKTGESVREISADAWALIDTMKRADLSPFVFATSHKKGGPIRDVSRLWDAVRHAAGISARFHDMRHTAASLAINSGATEAEVQSMLGHLSAASTRRYMKLFPSTGKRSADRVAAALQAATATPPASVKPITSKRRPA